MATSLSPDLAFDTTVLLLHYLRYPTNPWPGHCPPREIKWWTSCWQCDGDESSSLDSPVRTFYPGSTSEDK